MAINQLSRDDLNKAYSEQQPVYRNKNEFIVVSIYYSELGFEPKWLVDYIKISSKQQRVRTRDLVSFCKSFTTNRGN